MDTLEIVKDLFSNYAVPVACLIVTFRLWNKEREDHKQEMKEVTQALTNNTIAMQRLVDKLENE